MVGAWELADMETVELPEQVAKGFEAVTVALIGAVYTPVLYCGEQVVKGMNYMIICKQVLSDKEHSEHLVEMIINAWDGGYSLCQIKHII